MPFQVAVSVGAQGGVGTTTWIGRMTERKHVFSEANQLQKGGEDGVKMGIETNFSSENLEHIVDITVKEIPELLQNDVEEIVLYGSYARGDYTEDSDIDIAILTRSDRKSNESYGDQLDEIATRIGYDTYEIVNYVCLPFKEFEEKKSWYPYFQSIEREGVILYGR